MADVFRSMIMGLGLLALLWLGSCAIVGTTTVVAVSKVADTAAKTYKEEELKYHNERDNEAAAYHEHSDYSADYYDNYD